MLAVILFVKVSITETVLEAEFATYTSCAFRSIDKKFGLSPTVILVTMLFVLPSTTDTVLEPALATYEIFVSGSTDMPVGLLATITPSLFY
jgi:hypothetical protein